MNCTPWSDDLAARGSDLHLYQELMRGPEAADTVKAAANYMGYHALVRPSARTSAGGMTAGLVTASKWQYGFHVLADRGPQGPDPSRVEIVGWYGLHCEGIIVANVSLHADDRDGSRHQQLLFRLATELRSIGRPFIAGGDWNMSPSELHETGWLDLVKGVTCAPIGPTYISGKAESVLDYFAAHESLATTVKSVEASRSGAITKHMPVESDTGGCSKSRSCRE